MSSSRACVHDIGRACASKSSARRSQSIVILPGVDHLRLVGHDGGVLAYGVDARVDKLSKELEGCSAGREEGRAVVDADGLLELDYDVCHHGLGWLSGSLLPLRP